MGVVNVTPDSFSDGGQAFALEAAVFRGVKLVAEGADLLDVGGESTRPGSVEIDAETERRRVLPVVEALSARIPVPLSIDTYKASVAEAALAAGAAMVNDVYGLQREPDIARVAGDHGAAVIASHWEPDAPEEMPLLDAIKRYFDRSIAIARRAGIPDHRIVLDPGIGFGKDIDDNLVILNRLEEIVALGFPVLVGTSRKRFIGHLTGKDVSDRLAGSIASNVLAAAKGVAIVRVHDVAAHKDALKVADAISAGKPPA